MDADLDSLLTVVFCTADDLLPTPAGNARRIVTDAEVVTLAVAQVLLGYHDSAVSDPSLPSGPQIAQLGKELPAAGVKP
jgi:hypothetical protein